MSSITTSPPPPRGSFLRSGVVVPVEYMDPPLTYKFVLNTGHEKTVTKIYTLSPGKQYKNVNGHLCVESSIKYLVLNLTDSYDRYQRISGPLEKAGVDYSRFNAVKGKDMDADHRCHAFFASDTHRHGQAMRCSESGETWTFDKFVPSTAMNEQFPTSHHGNKGLWISNLLAFQHAYQHYQEYDWICVLEDDAIIDSDITKSIADLSTMLYRSQPHVDVVVLDIRCGDPLLPPPERLTGAGCCAVLYRTRALPRLTKDLHPLADTVTDLVPSVVSSALWDWLLFAYLRQGTNGIGFPLVTTNGMTSTISPQPLIPPEQQQNKQTQT
jgi:hypothetical protein